MGKYCVLPRPINAIIARWQTRLFNEISINPRFTVCIVQTFMGCYYPPFFYKKPNLDNFFFRLKKRVFLSYIIAPVLNIIKNKLNGGQHRGESLHITGVVHF